jgi:hypothetical protein
MLGAAHSLANGLTAVCGTVHGVAVGLMLRTSYGSTAAAGRTLTPIWTPTPNRSAGGSMYCCRRGTCRAR